MTAPEFAFPINELDAGGKEFRMPIRAAWLRGTLEDTEVRASDHEGQLDVRLSKTGTDVVVRGTLAADLIVPCSRCLEPTVVPVREELSALAVPKSAVSASRAPAGGAHGGGGQASGAGKGGAGKGVAAKRDKKAKDDEDLDDTELSGDEADVVVYEGDLLVLDELVRDELLLGIPMIPLCSEACPGISPGPSVKEEETGGETRVDPRLLPLLKLKNKT
ncbi:MAG TPA: DUF177 domain-containing protein [Polyangiaceae bacterium]|jgi:uncharacterized protein|nr:DUF177 domain-containing protein [Polyangiaceae bacterium]